MYNNPSMLLYLMATLKGYRFEWPTGEDKLMVVSVGTGTSNVKFTAEEVRQLGKKNAIFWGSTVPEFGMYPFYPEGVRAAEIIEVPGLACRPCSKIGFADCPKGHFRCMNEQDLTRICRALK